MIHTDLSQTAAMEVMLVITEVPAQATTVVAITSLVQQLRQITSPLLQLLLLLVAAGRVDNLLLRVGKLLTSP
jgi:hypothetical protein